MSKASTTSFYRDLAKVPHWREILKTAERAKHKWNMHVEVVTNIIPGRNDDDEQLQGIANWIKESLGELTPWHVTRFYPHHKLQESPPTPVRTIERACEIGRKAGLKFIYAGNVPGHPAKTRCAIHCGKTIVKRLGYQTAMVGLDGSRCRYCGADLNFRTGPKNKGSWPAAQGGR